MWKLALLTVLSPLLAQQAWADDTQYLYLGYTGGFIRFVNDGHPEISEKIKVAGLVHGIQMDWLAFEDEEQGRGVPIFAFALEFRGGGKGLSGRLADKTELVPDPLSPEDPVADYLHFLIDCDFSPWHFDVGPVALSPSLGLGITLPAYGLDFGLHEIDSEHYDDTDSYYAQSYGDFIGFKLGVWARWESLLGRVEATWSPLGPMIATTTEPATIWLIQSESGSSHSRHGGAPMAMRVELQWDKLVYFVPSLIWEGALWKVKTGESDGTDLGFTNRHRALYLNLSLGVPIS